MNSSYQIIRTLGRGAFGTTYLVEKNGDETNRKYVLKSIPINNYNIADMFAEINVLKKIAKYECNPRLLCYRDHFVNPNDKTMNIITDAFDDAITLGQFIRQLQKEKRYLSTSELLQIINSLLTGLAYLHKIGIAHGDIKPGNILINPQLETQIIDFGLSCSNHCKPSGTVLFASPEILRNMGSQREIGLETLQIADVFSMGLVIFLLANLEFPFSLYGNNPYGYDYKSSTRNDSDTNSHTNSNINSAPVQEAIQQNVPDLFKINNNNQILLIHSLDRFYNTLGEAMFSFYHNNETPVDEKINSLIESMLIIPTNTKQSRPSSRRLLSNLRKIIDLYNDTTERKKIVLTPLTPSMLQTSPVKSPIKLL
uniref:Protein kinase domain-containing protein n=1 Tax=viral metagenome TaxID=1070528 RepID=A0A6C0H827_9ZZZZ